MIVTEVPRERYMVFDSHRLRTTVRPPEPPTASLQPPLPPPMAPPVAVPDPVLVAATEAPPVLTMKRAVPGFALLDAHGQMVSAKGLPVPLNHVHGAVDAFGTEHASDLHFVLYVARSRSTGQVEQRVPRITKPALPFLAHAGKLAVSPEVKQQLADIEVCGTALAVDFDLPNHARWDEVKLADAKELFASLQQKSKIIASPTLFYTTAKGLRLVWLLTRAIPIEGPRGLHDLLGGLVITCHMKGFQVDASCSDWTRIFRLPRVMREDEDQFGNLVYSRTAAQQYLHQSWGCVDFSVNQEVPPSGQVLLHAPEAFRGLSEISYDEAAQSASAVTITEKWKNKFGRAPTSSTAAMEDVAVGTCPNDAEVQRLLHGADGGGKETPLARSVRSWVETRAAPKGKDAKPLPSAVEAADFLYYGRSFITDQSASGQLHAGILRLSCALGYVLRERLGEDDVSPQLMYALVMQVARRSNAQRPAEMQRDDATLSGEVWSSVEWAYRQFRSQVIMDEREEAEVKEACEISARNTLAAGEGFRTALTAELLHSIERGGGGTPPPPDDYAWVAGRWDKCLVVEVPESGISVASITRDGRICYSPLAQTQGALHTFIRDCGHQLITPTKPGAAPGSPLVLKSDTQILTEYGCVAGGLRASRLCDWNEVRLVAEPRGLVPYMVERVPGIRRDIVPRENPLVAEWLSLFAGPHHVDKLLDWLWAFPRIERACCGLYVEGDPGLGKGMLASALAHITESRMFAPFEEVADQFQDTLIKTPFVWLDEHQSKSGSGHRSVMHTFKKLVTGEFRNINLKGKPKREIEGHWRVLITANTGAALPVEDDMNDQDIAALTVRLMYLHARKEAGEFLTRIGGHEGTSGWVEREIPQHIMWIARHREVKRGSRLLVEGAPEEFHDNLTINKPSTDMTLRTLSVVVEDLQRYQEVATVKDGHLWVSSSELFNAFNTLFGTTRVNQLSPKAIEASLKMLSGSSHSKNFKSPSPKSKGRVLRRWDIPLSSLLKRLKNAGESIDLRKSFGEGVWREAVKGVLSEAEIREMCEQAPPAPPAPHIARSSGTIVSGITSPPGLARAGMSTAQLFSSPNAGARP